MRVKLFEGFFVDPDLVAVIKATGIDECALFTAGQSAIDGGFHIPYSAEEVDMALDEGEALDEDDGEEFDDEDPEGFESPSPVN